LLDGAQGGLWRIHGVDYNARSQPGGRAVIWPGWCMIPPAVAKKCESDQSREIMDFMHLLDMILHVDKSLGAVIAEYGTMVYAVLSGIVFAETGLVVLPFLPGDTLLFVAGAFCATGAMNFWVLTSLLVTAAVVGNTVNYWIGKAIGKKVFTHDYKWLDKAALQKTHAFYENHGGKTIILARFIPIVRTFAPFVAGVSEMTFAKFQLFNITGALLWVVGLVTLGYFFGDLDIYIPVINYHLVIKDHLNTIVLVGLCAAVVPLALGALWKFYKKVSGS
jgi:membrane-associated protein